MGRRGNRGRPGRRPPSSGGGPSRSAQTGPIDGESTLAATHPDLQPAPPVPTPAEASPRSIADPVPASRDEPIPSQGQVPTSAQTGDPSAITTSPDTLEGQARSGATLAQLRRFIKSRPYMPMHELRRRFGLDCEADEVHPIQAEECCLYIGLPAREAGFVGELIRNGEIGYELLLDPSCPLVIGVYAMRPVARS
jgi:hypothetical protein